MNTKQLRVWWVPQVPMEAFHVGVDSLEEGVKLLKVLADYDLFQLENKVKPDYCNLGGLQEWDEESQEWEEVDDELIWLADEYRLSLKDSLDDNLKGQTFSTTKTSN